MQRFLLPAAVLVLALVIVRHYWDAWTAVRDFRKCTWSATELVESCYDFHEDRDRWPTELDELVPTFIEALPPGWDYEPNHNPDVGPLLWRRGLYHQSVYFRFPASGEGDGVWTLSVEGSKTTVDGPRSR